MLNDVKSTVSKEKLISIIYCYHENRKEAEYEQLRKPALEKLLTG